MQRNVSKCDVMQELLREAGLVFEEAGGIS